MLVHGALNQALKHWLQPERHGKVLCDAVSVAIPTSWHGMTRCRPFFDGNISKCCSTTVHHLSSPRWEEPTHSLFQTNTMTMRPGLIDFTLNTLSCHHRFTNTIFYDGMNPVSVFSSSFETSSRVLLDNRALFVGWNIIRYSQLYMLLFFFWMTFRNIKVMCPLLRITQLCYFGILTMTRESNITSDHITVVSVVQQREL